MWIKRIILFVGGLFVMSLGVGLSIKSGLGVTPISSIPYSLTLASGVNIGITTVIFNVLLVFLQIPILKKRFNPKRLLQLINAFMFGYFTDLSLWILSPMPDLPLDVNFTLLIVSMFLIAAGILIYMPANIAPLPVQCFFSRLAHVAKFEFPLKASVSISVVKPTRFRRSA